MRLELDLAGDIVEQQDLLNGTRSVTLAGQSGDGAWSFEGTLSWSGGLTEYAGEGDITLTRDDGSELFGAATAVRQEGATEGESAELALCADYEMDGGSGAFESGSGRGSARIRVGMGGFEGRWCLELDVSERHI